MYYRFKFDGKKFNLNQNSKMLIECKKAINKVQIISGILVYVLVSVTKYMIIWIIVQYMH